MHYNGFKLSLIPFIAEFLVKSAEIGELEESL